jgi:hypothetical protein
MKKLRIVMGGISGSASAAAAWVRVRVRVRVRDRSRGRYATPADSPLHDGTRYRGLRVRRWGVGFVHSSRAILCRAVPNPKRYDSRLLHRCTTLACSSDGCLAPVAQWEKHEAEALKAELAMKKGVGRRGTVVRPSQLRVRLHAENPIPTVSRDPRCFAFPA